MHLPRLPALSQGTVAVMWAIVLGGFIFLLMLGIAVAMSVSIIMSILTAIVVYFAVVLFGQDRPRARN